jgi:hypothetical protein
MNFHWLAHLALCHFRLATLVALPWSSMKTTDFGRHLLFLARVTLHHTFQRFDGALEALQVYDVPT